MSIFEKMVNDEELKDIRGWWAPGLISFLVISFVVYCMHDDYSLYEGWSFWWRVIINSCIFGGGFLICVYCNGDRKSKVSGPEYLKEVDNRIKIFWVVSLFWLLFFSFMPGKMVKANTNNNFNIDDPVEWQRP